MLMCLIHDIVEIDAGDTYAYDQDGLMSQAEREQKAAQRIFGLLPKEQKDEMIQLFNESITLLIVVLSIIKFPNTLIP